MFAVGFTSCKRIPLTVIPDAIGMIIFFATVGAANREVGISTLTSFMMCPISVIGSGLSSDKAVNPIVVRLTAS
tara:strand:- start:3275 stop:3496 length:222 start_codon:yes stop_codon:yes gene_type:complete